MNRPLLDALDHLLELHGERIHTRVDAAACGTRSDWEAARLAADAYEAAYAAFRTRLHRLAREIRP